MVMAWYVGEIAYGVRIDPPLRYADSLRRRVGRELCMLVRVGYVTMVYARVGGRNITM